MAEPFEISDRYVDDVVALSPLQATQLGIRGSDHLWDDFGPEGLAAVHDLHLRLLAATAVHLDHRDPRQRLAARVLHARATEFLEADEAGDPYYDLNHMVSSFQRIREAFDVMDKRSAQGWDDIVARLEGVGEAFAGYRRRLDEGIGRGLIESMRQARSVLDQARDLAGERSAWLRLASEAETGGFRSARLDAAIESARAHVAEFARYVADDYLPKTTAEDGVGHERYLRGAEQSLGSVVDPIEVYEWGWEEIARLRKELRSVGEEILPGAHISEVARHLETDPDRSIEDHAAFIAFIEERQSQALADLDGVHFDVPEQIKQVSVNLAPPGGALGAYYLSPSEDFTRPGGIWYVLEDRPVPLYQEVSTAYHEGFPGHHLQVGTSMAMADRLSRAHRVLIWYSGYGEGWALYTERLMDELGYFEKPDYVFGMLASHVFRAARVVVDVGLHLGLTIPAGAPLHAGKRWDFDLGVDYMTVVGMQPPAYAASEVRRYLGWPGQAISYKVGEREILALRDEVRARKGPDFDLKAFHSVMLTNGELRLDMLREVVLAD